MLMKRVVIMSYKLSENWYSLVEDVRAGRLTSTTPSVVWNNGTRHGLQEGSVSRDIISFFNRRENYYATRDECLTCIPWAFNLHNKLPEQNAQDYLRELVKMGILTKEQT